jgi:MFS family permease
VRGTTSPNRCTVEFSGSFALSARLSAGDSRGQRHRACPRAAVPQARRNCRLSSSWPAPLLLGGFLFGFDSAVINGAVSGTDRGFHSSSGGTGFRVAAILLGLRPRGIGGRIADEFGRRPTMVASASLFAITAVASALAPSEQVFAAARFLSGLGIRAASVVCPAYIAEIPPERLRGRLASLQQLGIVLGIFMTLLSDEMLAGAVGGTSATPWAGLEAWRWMFLVEVSSGTLRCVCPGRHESQRYLVARAGGHLRRLPSCWPSCPSSSSADGYARHGM